MSRLSGREQQKLPTPVELSSQPLVRAMLRADMLWGFLPSHFPACGHLDQALAVLVLWLEHSNSGLFHREMFLCMSPLGIPVALVFTGRLPLSYKDTADIGSKAHPTRLQYLLKWLLVQQPCFKIRLFSDRERSSPHLIFRRGDLSLVRHSHLWWNSMVPTGQAEVPS